MNGAVLLLIASAAFLAGYFIYAKLIERKLGVDPSIPTPAHTKKDGVDFIPAHPTQPIRRCSSGTISRQSQVPDRSWVRSLRPNSDGHL